jgi:hypothetical protein
MSFLFYFQNYSTLLSAGADRIFRKKHLNLHEETSQLAEVFLLDMEYFTPKLIRLLG